MKKTENTIEVSFVVKQRHKRLLLEAICGLCGPKMTALIFIKILFLYLYSLEIHCETKEK